MINRILIILSIIGVTLFYAIYQVGVLDDKLATEDVLKANSVIKALPDVRYKVFNSDEIFFLREKYNNQVTVVHFWATWCAPCEKEFPSLIKLTKQFPNKEINFLFVAVNDDSKKIEKFLSKNEMNPENSVVLLDEEGIHQKSFGTYRLPETFIFNKKGEIVKKLAGAQEWDKPYFVDLLSVISK